MPDTIFSRILEGKIPAHKVYEDDLVLAFLDIGPLSEGHTLVIPKEPAATLDTLSDTSAAAVGRALPRIARAVMKVTGASDYNVLQNNGESAHQAVHHVHFHVIPRFTTGPDAGTGLEIKWRAQPFDHAQGAALAKQIADEITRDTPRHATPSTP